MPGPECPTDDDLRQYLLGQLTLPEIDAISSHLEHCLNCTAWVEELDDSTTPYFVQLRELEGLAVDDKELSHLIARVQAIYADRVPAIAVSSPPTERTAEWKRNIGDYVLDHALGHGAFGDVYLAQAPLLGRMVAVKILRNMRDGDVSVRQRFLQEMRAVGRIPPHPNVVHATHAGDDDGVLYLVMDWVDGITLSAAIKNRGVNLLAVNAVCEVIRQAALGLQHIHEYGLVHRDVKPANLMLDQNGTVKLLDLGLAGFADATDLDRLTGEKCFVGTRGFVAPEQAIDAADADIKADIYSLGCTFHCLLEGRSLQVDLSGVSAQPQRSDLTRALLSVLQRMVAYDREDRYQTPAEVAVAVAPWCGSNAREVLIEWAQGNQKRSTTLETTVRIDSETSNSFRWLRPSILWGLIFSLMIGVVLMGLHFGKVDSAKTTVKLATLPGSVDSLSMTTNGKHAVVGVQSHFWTIGIDRREELANWKLEPTELKNSNPVFSGDGLNVCVGVNAIDSGQLQFFRSDTGVRRGPGMSANPLKCLASAPVGERILACTNSGGILLWDGESKRGNWDFGTQGYAFCAAFDPSGVWFVCGCADRMIRIGRSDLTDGASSTLPTQDIPAAVGFSTTVRQVISASLERQIVESWDLETGRSAFAPLEINHPGLALCVAFAVSGRIAVAGHAGGMISVWDLVNQRQLTVFRHQSTDICSVAVDGDGKWAVGGDIDGGVWLYGLPKGG